MKLNNVTALVTGANRGIGVAFVQSLLRHGAARVYAGARNTASLAAVQALDPQRVIPLQLDVTSEASLGAAASQTSGVQLLINNAGVLDFGSVLDAPRSVFERNFDVNFYGLLDTTRAFLPQLEQSHGAVVNVLTLVALASMPGLGVYNASKAAAWSLTQSLRADLGKRGIAVFNSFPGAVDTDMLKAVEIPKASPGEIADQVLAGVEAGHEDIFPGDMAAQTYSAWRQDHKAVERQFASM